MKSVTEMVLSVQGLNDSAQHNTHCVCGEIFGGITLPLTACAASLAPTLPSSPWNGGLALAVAMSSFTLSCYHKQNSSSSSNLKLLDT
jgi:hypothetical protein